MNYSKNYIHNSFQLNGYSFSNSAELLNYRSKISKDVFLFLEEWFSDSNSVIIQTSGSTGKPKNIELQKERMFNSAIATGNYFNLKAETTALLCLPASYVAGKMMLIRALTLGWSLDIVTPNSNPLQNVPKIYDFSAMVPLQVENSINYLDKIRKLIVGGGVVSNPLLAKLQNVSTDVFATYGMTETITHIAVKKLNNFSTLKTNFNRSNFYKTLPNVTIYVDERNCLVINAVKVSEKVLFTNDVVRLISDTQFEWLGRFDNVINSGGVKLQPEVIESKLVKVLQKPFFVAGILDDLLGSKLILIIEDTDDNTSEKKEGIINKIKSLNLFTKFEIPKEIYFLPEFMYTESSKIQRNKTLNLLKL